MGADTVIVPHGTDFVFLYAPGLLILSVVILLCAYLVSRKLTSSQVYWAISAPGVTLTVIYFLDLRSRSRLGLNVDYMYAVTNGLILLPGIWIFPLVTAVTSCLIYFQRKTRPASSVSALTIIVSASLVTLYFATAYMTDVLGDL